jgi:HD-GYP domain-containing protein (c-di-GMP phosphodiesterase class II)
VSNLLVPLVLASLALQVVNSFFLTWFFSGVRKTPFGRSWVVRFKDLLWGNLLTVPTAALLAILFVSVHPLTLLLFLVSLPAQRWAAQLFYQQERIFSQAVNSLVVAIDANFPEGRGHSRRVADMAVATARQLGLADSVVEGIELGALVHDVGMIGLEELVESSGPSDTGRLLEHVKAGAEVATEMPRRDIRDIVLYHHEHFDGKGYLGLRGSQIPIGARVVALAEAVESMVRPSGPRSDDSLDEVVVRKVREEAGKQFDPRVVDAFLEVARDDPGLLRSRSETPPPSLAARTETGSK